ncbi:MAG: response regulator [Calditrichaeota bacterium]|nr:MAG: response regulator [Calditrichota bacterium]
MNHRKKHILVVDDEENLLSSLEFILDASNYRVTIAREGFTALSILKKSQLTGDTVDLIITDLIMPGLSGCELIHQIRKNQFKIPILIITGDNFQEDIDCLIQDKQIEFILKPIDEVELLDQIKKMLTVQQPGLLHQHP